MRHPLPLCALIPLALLIGCAGSSAAEKERQKLADTLSSLHPGMAEAEVKTAFGSPGAFQFTARVEGVNWVGLRYELGAPHIPYYAVFRGGRLARVIEPAALDEGAPWTPLTGDERFGAVLRAGDLTNANAPKLPPATRPSPEPAPSLARARLVEPGMTMPEVRQLLGEPIRTVGPQVGTITWIYAEPETPDASRMHSGGRAEVLFINAQVERVFSGDFFDARMLAGH